MASEILLPLNKDQAHPEPSQLCFNCQNMIDHWPNDSDPQRARRRFSHYGSESALIASADHGCCLCRQFLLGCKYQKWSNWQWDEGDEPRHGEGRVELDSGLSLRFKSRYRDCYWSICLFIPASPYNARSGSHAPRTEEEYLYYEVAGATVAASGKLNFSLNLGFKAHYLLQKLPNFSIIAGIPKMPYHWSNNGWKAVANHISFAVVPPIPRRFPRDSLISPGTNLDFVLEQNSRAQ
jgi:hypothetical protein